MANEKNLKPFKKGDVSSEEAKKRGSKGGKKSVENKKKRKLFKETILDCLNTETPEKMREQLKQNFPELANSKIDLQTSMILSLIKTSMSGSKNSVQAFLAMRDTVGEKPEDKSRDNITITIKGLKKK